MTNQQKYTRKQLTNKKPPVWQSHHLRQLLPLWQLLPLAAIATTLAIATTFAMPPLLQCHHFCNATTSAMPPFWQCHHFDNAVISNITPQPPWNPPCPTEYCNPRNNSEGAEGRHKWRSHPTAPPKSQIGSDTNHSYWSNIHPHWPHRRIPQKFWGCWMVTTPSTPTLSSPQNPSRVLRVPDGIFNLPTKMTKSEVLPTDIETSRNQQKPWSTHNHPKTIRCIETSVRLQSHRRHPLLQCPTLHPQCQIMPIKNSTLYNKSYTRLCIGTVQYQVPVHHQ